MIKLIIETPGLFIQGIRGLAPFRTPAEVNITRLNISYLIIELRKNGVEKFKIISDVAEPKKIKESKMVAQKQIIEDNRSDDIFNKFDKKLDKIIEIIAKKDLFKSITNEETKRKKKDIRVDDDFVPTISEMTLKGETSFSVHEREDVLDAVEQLKKINQGDD